MLPQSAALVDMPRIAGPMWRFRDAAGCTHSMNLGIPAKIFVPAISSPAKVQRIRDYRAELVVTGNRYADALAASEVWAEQSGALSVHAFDQPETLLGQGTIGLEIEEQSADLDTLLVAVDGGELIAGIAAWFGGNVKVVGVEPEAAPTLSMALKAGGPGDRSGFSSASPRRHAGVPHRQATCGPRSLGSRRSDQPSPTGSLGDLEGSRRAWRCCRLRRAHFASL